MPKLIRPILLILLAAAALLLIAWPEQSVAQVIRRGRGAPAEAKPAPEPPAGPPISIKRPDSPQGTFELVEWVVMVVDPNRPNANDAAAFKSTVPGFARGRRSAPASTADMKNPSPVGVIRLLGKQGSDDGPIDVLIQTPSGRFLGYWPQGKPRSNRQLWEKVVMKAGTSLVVPADAGHWFDTLRGAGAAPASPLSTSRWSENFLLYDCEVAYPSVLRVKAADKPLDGYRLANAGSTILRDVEVYAPVEGGGGWRVAGLKELAATKAAPATQPALGGPALPEGPAEVPAGPATEVLKQIFSEVNANVKPVDVKVEDKTAATKATSQATTRPTTQASTQPTTKPVVAEEIPKDAWRDVKLAGDAKALPVADAVAPWSQRLKDAGLTAADIEVILATLRTHALDPEQLTVVYRIDPSELDRMLPMEVVPMPAKVTRVGIAIVKNIDPAAGERIAKLVEQLGNSDWEKREAAQAKLAELGAGARPKLTEALKHKDVEVVYRAERLLESINNPQ